MTIPTQLVLRVLLEEPGAERYGYEVGEAAGLASGTVHPILARLEGVGWVEDVGEYLGPATRALLADAQNWLSAYNGQVGRWA